MHFVKAKSCAHCAESTHSLHPRRKDSNTYVLVCDDCAARFDKDQSSRARAHICRRPGISWFTGGAVTAPNHSPHPILGINGGDADGVQCFLTLADLDYFQDQADRKYWMNTVKAARAQL